RVGPAHLPGNREAAGPPPVVGDELLEQFGNRGAAPGDPPLALQEPALLFAWQECLAIMQLTKEVDTRFRRLERVHHLKARARQPAWDVDAAEHVVGHEFRGGDRKSTRLNSS